MRKTIYIAFFIVLLVSCTSNTIYKKPKNLIERDQMVALWVDIYIAKGAKSVKTKDLQKNIDYIPFVLRKYQIDSAQFSESNIYYTSRIDDYENMFQEVKERLETMKKKYEYKVPIDSLPLDIQEDLKSEKNQKQLENIMKH